MAPMAGITGHEIPLEFDVFGELAANGQFEKKGATQRQIGK